MNAMTTQDKGFDALFRTALSACGALLVTCAVLLMICVVAEAQVPADLDGDGRSDFVLLKGEKDGSLSWSARLSSSGSVAALERVGKLGDHIILGRWTGGGIAELGVVGLAADRNAIAWRVLGSDGTLKEQRFGLGGDLVMSGGDFNGNGLLDLAVVRVQARKLSWYVRYDGFAGGTAESSVLFGGRGSRPFFASVKGRTDAFGTVQKGRRNRAVVRFKNAQTGRVQTSNRFPASVLGSNVARPVPVRQPTGESLLLFAVPRGSNVQLLVFTAKGRKVATPRVPKKGDIVVGDFLDAKGEEIAVQNGAVFTLFNPVTRARQEVAVGEGIVVDEVNINEVRAAPLTPTPPPISSEGCSRVVAWPASHIYKRIGSSHFTDIRRNTIGVVIKPGGPGPFPSCIQAVDTQGNVQAQLGLYARGDGWAARYYAGIGCGGDTPFNGATIGANARSRTGSPLILMNFGGVCYGPIDATKCIGSSQC